MNATDATVLYGSTLAVAAFTAAWIAARDWRDERRLRRIVQRRLRQIARPDRGFARHAPEACRSYPPA